MTQDRSLFKLLRINRNITKTSIPIPQPHPTDGYDIYDFGENVINNHFPSDGSHSEKCQTIFNYVVSDFKNRCNSIQSYNTHSLGNGYIFKWQYLEKCALVDADLIFVPYVNAAYSSAGEYNNFILAVASHHENNGSDGNLYDDERHDLTADNNTFLKGSIAVSARRDTSSTFKDYTSYGFGMEFFEDCSPEALDVYYPNKDIPSAFAELLSEDGINLTSNVHLSFSQYVTVGQTITIRYSADSSTWQTTVVSEIVSPNHIRVITPITPITTPSIYGWRNVTLGTYCGGQAQSWAVPLVAGKLKVIKMTTMSDWDTVRAAARITAKRNPTGIPEIDNVNWDMYRGFGCIDVNAAIQYINNQ